MSNGVKIVITMFAIVIVAFCILYVGYNYFKTQPIDANTVNKGNIIADANTGLANMLNEILSEENVNNVVDEDNLNTESNTEKEETTSNSENSGNTSNSVDETEEDNSTIPREKKAIELVKEEWENEWGNTSGVTFNNIGIQSDGQYRVSVNDSRTTEVIQFYIVDVDTGLVKEK